MPIIHNINTLTGRIPAILAALALILASAGCALFDESEPTHRVMVTDVADLPATGATIRFGLPRDLPVARAKVNDEDVGFFLLDTGSSLTVVDQALARRIKLTATGESRKLLTISGPTRAAVYRISSLTVSGARFDAQEAVALDLASFGTQAKFPIAGIMGFHNLADQLFTIDYRRWKIDIHEPAGFTPPAGAQPHRLVMAAGLPAVEGVFYTDDQPAREIKGWLQIDTGSNAGVSVPLWLIRQHPGLVSRQRNLVGQSHGAAGATTTIGSRLSLVRLMGGGLPDLDASIEPAAPPARGPEGQQVIGRLGNKALRHFNMTFDLRNNRLWVQNND